MGRLTYWIVGLLLLEFGKLVRADSQACITIGPLKRDPTPFVGTNPQLAYATGNESYVLGWQLSGLFGTSPELSTICAQYDQIASKVKKTGLDIEAIKLPFCNRVNCNISNDRLNILSNLIGYVGNLFLSELTAAVVSSKQNWLTLCNTINPALTSIFFGPTNVVVPTVCGYAGVAKPPAPDVGSNNVPADAADIIHNAATSLLAWEIVAFLQKPSDVQYFCNHFAGGDEDILPNVSGLDLNATLFQVTVCQYLHKPLPSASEIRDHYFVHGTEIFAESLWSVSDSSQFRRFVCSGYKKGCLTNFAKPVSYVGSAKQVFDGEIISHCHDAGVDA